MPWKRELLLYCYLYWFFFFLFFLTNFLPSYAVVDQVKGKRWNIDHTLPIIMMFPENSIPGTNKAHLIFACFQGCEKRISTFMFGKNNKMFYCQESPRCRARVRECCICYAGCIINSRLDMFQLKCEVSVFINESHSATGVMNTDCPGVLGCGFCF